ncbi:MAG: UDP-N-acetylmuramoyl-L-alanine--D-glutamate ligase [Chlamydiia bacterium]
MEPKQVLILGCGRSGRAVIPALQQEGCEIWVYDDRAAETPEGCLRWSGESNREGVSQRDWTEVILSPGFAPHHPIVVQLRAQGVPILSEVEFGLRRLDPGVRLGITGTNGKTTTTELAAWMLQQAGHRASACGNNGVPLSGLPSAAGSGGLVIELSSYQLEEVQRPFLDDAVYLNLTPDHLDRYGSMEAYALAKGRILDLMRSADRGELLVHSSLLNYYPTWKAHPQIRTFGSAEADLRWESGRVMMGATVMADAPGSVVDRPQHDWLNALAAGWLAVRQGLSWPQVMEHWSSFDKGPHRCQWIADRQGVRYINDSKGTNLDATLQAMLSYPPGQILIAGGVHKGASYAAWRECVRERVQRILTIGQAAEQIESELGDLVPVERCTVLDRAVVRAAELAQPGETVLLSPGCASTDQFRDYRHRGECFEQYVLQLPATSDNVKRVG